MGTEGVGLYGIITYDVLTPNPNVNAFFLVGSENFLVVAVQERVAYRVGFDVALDICNNLQLQITGDYEHRKTYNDLAGMLKLKYLF